MAEGLGKDSIVLKVDAFDRDRNNDGFTYEIIEGNVDGAFAMKTAQPGIIFTNTVLDREIRDRYLRDSSIISIVTSSAIDKK